MVFSKANAPESPSHTDGSSTPVHLETTNNDGQPTTVVRDSAGQLAYPGYVPQQVQSPIATGSPAPEHHPPSQAVRRRSNIQNDLPRHEPATENRPSFSKKFVSEAPRRGQRHNSTVPPIFKRAGTNVSLLDQGLLSRQHAEESSSESSSEDEAPAWSKTKSEAGGNATRPKPAQRRNEDSYRRFRVGNENYHTRGNVSKKDGRLNISVKDTSNTGYLAKALGAAVKRVIPPGGNTGNGEGRPSTSRVTSTLTGARPDPSLCPRLNIVIMVIGSRGDAQPFLKIGKVLKEQYGHRVRIATHPAFRDFVEKDSGLEFFSVGGDPAELMAFMVKNPGMIPTLATVKAGDIGRRRTAMAEMFEGFWRACTNATDDETDIHNLKMMGDKLPFVADAIIANPPSFAHIHCAEALGIPLHMMFTMPYTPTEAFPHPLASIKKSNVDPGYTNFISYPLVEMMVWQGLGDLVNNFRAKTLGLDPVSTLWAPGATYRLHVPFTYLWSPGLVPKPEDWGDEIDVSGFVFLDLASAFKPPDPLTKFMDSGEPPVYIGFGSIVVDDANRFTDMIFEAVKLAGVRALVSKGWGGLGGDEMDLPDNIFMLENTPHDWLFPKVRAAVIHGGAGTTAIALKCGRPTMIVPFFGDQHFWGSMVSNAGAGPEPVPYKHLTAEKLAEGIKYCLTKEAATAAGKLARGIEEEGDGAENACRAFHKHLTFAGANSMRCSILEDRVATWHLKGTHLRLSSMAADVIVEKGYLPWRKLELLRHNEWNDFEGPGEPVTGAAGSLATSVGDIFGGIGGVPYRIAKSSKKRKEKKERKKIREQKKREQAQQAASGVQNGSAHPVEDGHGADTGSEDGQKKPNGKKDQLYVQPSAAVDHATHTEKVIPSPQPNNKPDTSNKPHANSKREANGQVTGEHLRKPDDGENDEDLPSVATALHRTQTTDTVGTVSTVELNNPAEEFVVHVGKGAAKSARALARAPVDLSMAVAQGFHNAPRLYGDDTVRPPPRVTGIKSGLRAAGREFALGVYDGTTGLVRLPVRGARANGARGFTKGVGMGLLGFALKNIASMTAPVAYTFKGVAKQLNRGSQPSVYVRRARIIQGQRELKGLSPEERRQMEKEVERGWAVLRTLWEELEAKDRAMKGRKGAKGLKSRLGVAHRRKWGRGPSFQSVAVAEKALEKVRKGDDVDEAVARQARSTLGGRRSKDRAGGSSAKNKSSNEDDAIEIRPSKELVRADVDEDASSKSGGMAKMNGTVPGRKAPHGFMQVMRDEEAALAPATQNADLNPFSTSQQSRAANKAVARQDEQELSLNGSA